MTLPSGPRTAEVLVGLSLLLAFLAAFSGFPRFDVVQLSLASFAGGAALLLWAFMHARNPERHHGTTLSIPLLWAGLLAWLFAGILVSGLQPEGMDRLALFALPLAPLLWSVRTDSFRPARIAAIAGTIAAAGLAFACILQAFGVAFPQAIPFSTATGDGLRGTLDHPMVGAAAALLLLPTLAIASLEPDPRWRKLATAGLVCASIALGLMAKPGIIAIAAVGALAGAALLIARGGRGKLLSRYALLALGPIILASLLQATAQPEPGSLPEPQRTTMQEMALAAWDFAADSPEFRAALGAGAWDAATDALPFGRGAGSFSAEAPLHIGSDAQHRRTMGAVAMRDLRAPSPFAELLTEGGIPLALLLLLLLGAPALLVLRKTSPEKTPPGSQPDMVALQAPLALHGLVVFTGALIAAHGLLHAAPLATAGLLLASIARIAGNSEAPPRTRKPIAAERWLGGVLPVSVLATVLLVAQLQALFWGYNAARGDVFMGHAYLAEAQSAYESAHRWQIRFHSLYNSAQLSGIRSEDRHAASTDDFREAIRLRPNLLEPRFRLADVMVRQLPVGLDAMTESFRRSADILRHARTLDPTHVETVRLLADIEIMRGNHETSVELLETLIGLDMTPRVRSEIFHRLGQLHDDFLNDPARALHNYELAAEHARSPSMINILRERITAMQNWIQTGDRPAAPPAHSHGPFDDHDHDHGHHHGHDHEPEQPHDHEHRPEQPHDHDQQHDHGHDHEQHDHGHDHEHRPDQPHDHDH